MLRNDLSNKSAPVLAFCFETVVCSSFYKKLLNIKYSIDKQNVNAINKLYRKEFSIYYVTFEYPGKKLDKLENELDNLGCMFNGTIRVDDINSLLYWFRQHSGWYYDTDINRVSFMYPYGQKWEKYLTQLWNK